MEQIALVTGADRGLGSALTAGLLERGWCVFAGQHRPDWPELDALARRFPETLHVIPLEVRSMESVRAAAQEISGITDQIDVLMNTAGVGPPSPSPSIREPQDYDEMHR